MTDAPHILVVDDHREIRDAVTRYLEKNGMRAQSAKNTAEMDAALKLGRFDLVILDVMMPGEDGLSAARRLSAAGGPPILMLSALSDETDRIIGLEIGADDYLPKPFNPRELLARISAVLRRVVPDDPPGAPSDHSETYVFGEFSFDLAKRALTRNGEPVPLTSGEFSVLKVLARHARQPLSREKLMELARGREYEVFDRSLDVQISRLRKLIEPDPSTPRFIQTVWGLGYVFIPDGIKS